MVLSKTIRDKSMYLHRDSFVICEFIISRSFLMALDKYLRKLTIVDKAQLPDTYVNLGNIYV